MRQLAIIVDLDRCTGFHACSIACKQENNVPLGAFWHRVYEIGPHGTFPDLAMYFLPIACQHCRDPSCVKVCPTGASYRREDGIVLIDQAKCIGCRSCIQACPYGVHDYDSEKKKTHKCTLCAHLVDRGDQPACVKTCTAKARFYGDLNDPQSDIAVRLSGAGGAAYSLKPEADTKPSTRYLLRKQKWIARG